ncbi:MAG: hypothetical protein Q8Q85_05990 [Gemmatimonadales bacterium]|nr:hypothetical protein [Gemmatimonadales bacterium]
MTDERVPSDRLTTGQAVAWGVGFAVILALLVLFFRYGRHVSPLLNL